MESRPLPISPPVDPTLLRPDNSLAPYVWPLTVQAVVAAGWALISELQNLGFGYSDLREYRAWVYRPEVMAGVIILFVALIAMLAVVLPILSSRARMVSLLVSVTIGLVVGSVGLHESIARRHLGRELDGAMAAVRIVGATPVGPVVDDSQPVVDGEPTHPPGRAQTWRLPGHGRDTACAAIVASAHTDKGWTTAGGCKYTHHFGRVVVEMEPSLGKSDNWSVELTAVPNYFSG